MKVLITGGAGFIGSNFVRYILSTHPDYEITNLDALTYAGNLENLSDIAGNPRYTFVKGDMTDRPLVEEVMKGCDAVLNFAAESHVDRSILEPDTFIKTNVLGTQVLLETARINKVSRFIQVSTDEVYGSLGPEGYFTEESPLMPNSPYAASKAGGDLIARAYYKTYGLPVIITRSSNNYGPYQFPEKLIPYFIARATRNESLPLYGDGRHIRDWIHVEDNCQAIDLVLQKGRIGGVYNIGGNCEKTNLEVAKAILKSLKKPESLIEYVKDRPGHDRRYAIDSTKVQKELDWRPKYTLEEGLARTIEWYLTHQNWVESLLERLARKPFR